MKKKYLLIIILLLSLLVSCKARNKFSGGFAIVYQDNTPYLLNKAGDQFSLDKYDYISDVFGEYIVVGKYVNRTMKYGYIDHNGKEIIKAKYDMAYPFGEGLAVVVKKGAYLLINTKGQTVCQFESGIQSYDYFQNGFLKVEENHQFKMMNKNYEFSPLFDGIENYQGGYALCYNMTDGKKAYFLMDTSFQTSLQNELATYTFADSLCDGWMRIGKEIDDTFYYSFMNPKGEILKDANGNQLFENANNFHDGLALIFTGQPYDQLKDEYGSVILNFYSVQYLATDGSYPDFDYSDARARDKEKYLDKMIMGDFVGDFVYFRIITGGASYYTLNKRSGSGGSASLDEITIKTDNNTLTQIEKDSYRRPYGISLKASSFYQEGQTTVLCVTRVYSDYYGIVDESGNYIFDAIFERVIL